MIQILPKSEKNVVVSPTAPGKVGAMIPDALSAEIRVSKMPPKRALIEVILDLTFLCLELLLNPLTFQEKIFIIYHKNGEQAYI